MMVAHLVAGICQADSDGSLSQYVQAGWYPWAKIFEENLQQFRERLLIK